MLSNKKVTAVVVTYNRKELLVECIEALIAQTYQNFDIVIIDNASTDGTKDKILPYINNNKILYYNTGSNLGGAGGFNFGIATVAKLGCDYLWIMDDDTIATSNALEELVNAAGVLNDDFGFLSSYVKYTDGSFCMMNRQRVDRFNWIEDCHLINQGLLRVERATFVSFFIKTHKVYEVGLPIKEFFIWGDDTEYSYRISRRYKCFFVNTSIVIHKMQTNTNTNTNSLIEDNSDRVGRYFYNFRNNFYISKTAGTTETIKYVLKFFQINLLLLVRCKKKKWKKIRAIWKGFIYGMFFNPKIEYISVTKNENNI